MKVISGIPILNNSIVGIGFFDGVHIGHIKLIEQVVNLSKSMNMPSVIITFKKSPAEKFVQGVKYITSNPEKRKIMADLGIDNLAEIYFTNKFMNISAYDFIKDSLIGKLSAKAIVTGFNFSFGRNREGNSKTLTKLQNEFGYKYVEIDPVMTNDTVVSSTYIRKLLKNGKIEDANRLLYMPFNLSGKVIKGNSIGSELGFPTANVLYEAKKVEIPYGVYSVLVKHRNVEYKGIMNYGVKPTVNGLNREPVLEVHLLNFEKNIYNKNIEIKILKRIREEKRFNSLTELKSQIEKDMKEC